MAVQKPHKFSDYFENLYQNGDTEALENFNSNFTHLYHKETFPCFFTGDFNLSKPIVTISLNPKYDIGKKEEQGDDFQNWLLGCSNGFAAYNSDKNLHLIWKNLSKVFFSNLERESSELHSLLQKNVVNLDWCYYYSNRFPTLGIKELDHPIRKRLYESFNANIRFLLRQLNPRLIFLHGKTLSFLFDELVSDHDTLHQFNHGSKSYKVLFGFESELRIPVIYQEWFINRGNKTANIASLNESIQQILHNSSSTEVI